MVRISVTRIFCGTCGSAVSHKSPHFGENQPVQTGNFADFAKIPIAAEGGYYSSPRVSLSTDEWDSLRQGSLDWIGSCRGRGPMA